MLRTTLIRGLTLLSFTSLIIVFLLYRSGRLFPVQKELQSSHNGGVLANTARKDTIANKQKVKLMLPSSKVAILVDEDVWRDSMLHRKDTSVLKKVSRQLMSSSKSAIIFSTESINLKGYSDSLHLDSSLIKTKKKK